MKRIIILMIAASILVIASAFAFAPIASADGPAVTCPNVPDAQPWMFPTALESGYGTVESVQLAFCYFQNAQAARYQYTNSQMWNDNYNRDVRAFLAKNKSGGYSISDNFVMSQKLLIDLPTAMCGLRGLRCLE